MIKGKNYYSRTKKSEKFYYIIGDAVSRKKAQQQAMGIVIEGEGIFSNGLACVTSHFTPNQMSDRLKKRLNIDGNTPISKMMYSRKPIAGGIKTALNVLTLGKLSQKQRDLKYEQIFHDSVIIYLSNGHNYRLEKNHIIELNDLKISGDEKLIPIPIDRTITINELIKNANTDGDFYKYDHKNNNCQKFSNDIVKKSNLDNAEIDNEIKIQDASKLTSVLPDGVNDAMNIITNVAGMVSNTIDPVIHGKGLKKQRKTKKLKYGGDINGNNIRYYNVPMYECNWVKSDDGSVKYVCGYKNQHRMIINDPKTGLDRDIIVP
jgi:hypothetical protein